MIQVTNKYRELLLCFLTAIILLIYSFPLFSSSYVFVPLFYLIIYSAVSVTAIGYILLNVKIRFRCSDLLLAVSALYFLLRTFTADFPFYEVSGLIICVLIYVTIRCTEHKQYRLILKTLIAIGIVESVVVISQWNGVLQSHHSYFKVSGTFANPALSGCLLAVASVGAFYFFLKNIRNRSLAVYLPAILLIITGLIMTDSRAAWLGAIIGFCFVFYRIFLKNYRFNKLIVCGMVILLSAGTVYLYNYKKNSADGRLFVWKNTVSGIAEKPILGHGKDSFEREYIYLQAGYFEENPGSKYINVAGNPSSAFNEFLRILFEYGIIFFLLVIFILINSLRTRDTAINGCLLAFCVFAFFSYPLEIFRLYIFLPILLAMNPGKEIYTVENKAGRWLGTVFTLLITASFPYYFIKEYKRWNDIAFNVSERRILTADQYKHMKGEQELFFIYYNTVKSANRSQLVKDAVELYPSTQFLCDLAEQYKENGDNKAEKYYKTAIASNPSLVMPRYNLFELYMEKQDTVSAVSIATEIINQNVKIQNTRTIKAQARAKRFLEEIGNGN